MCVCGNEGIWISLWTDSELISRWLTKNRRSITQMNYFDMNLTLFLYSLRRITFPIYMHIFFKYFGSNWNFQLHLNSSCCFFFCFFFAQRAYTHKNQQSPKWKEKKSTLNPIATIQLMLFIWPDKSWNRL